MNTSDPFRLIVSGIYYLAVAILVFFSIFSIYVLLRYGRNRTAGLVICVVYAAFFLTILEQSYRILLSLP